MIAGILKTDIDFDAQINAITTHSDLCQIGDLFIALPGEKFNGADFLHEAKKRGAVTLSETKNGDLRVRSANEALLAIASAYADIISPKYRIAITGSTGKTTVKDFTASILSSVMKTHKTKDNLNNSIGVPYTLLSTPTDTAALVCEMGMNHKGEIDILSRAVRPDVSVITNVGSAHIGNLGSKKAIAEAKLEIQNGMNESAKTVIFEKETLLSDAKNPYIISYVNENADLFARILSKTKHGAEIYIKTASYETAVSTALYSDQTIDSLLMAIAVSDIIGIDAEKITSAVKGITPDSLRQKFIYANGYKIYDDSYNSSPEAVIADLKMLKEYEDKVSAVIGDMLELGKECRQLHQKIGAECARHSVKKLYAFGEYAEDTAYGAINAGMKKECVFINADLSCPQLTAMQISKSYSSETLLIKASHSVKADRIIHILENEKRIDFD